MLREFFIPLIANGTCSCYAVRAGQVYFTGVHEIEKKLQVEFDWKFDEIMG